MATNIGAPSQASTAIMEYDEKNKAWIYDEPTAPTANQLTGAERFNDWFKEFKRKSDLEWRARHPLSRVEREWMKDLFD